MHAPGGCAPSEALFLSVESAFVLPSNAPASALVELLSPALLGSGLLFHASTMPCQFEATAHARPVLGRNTVPVGAEQPLVTPCTEPSEPLPSASSHKSSRSCPCLGPGGGKLDSDLVFVSNSSVKSEKIVKPPLNLHKIDSASNQCNNETVAMPIICDAQ